MFIFLDLIPKIIKIDENSQIVFMIKLTKKKIALDLHESLQNFTIEYIFKAILNINVNPKS